MQPEESTPSTGGRLRRLLFGHKRHATDPHVFHKLSLVAFLAWVGLGADGISSSCYGPPEAFKVLGQHHYLAIFLAVMTAGTIFIISASYKHIIEQFPSGGGGYLVASKLLSPGLGAVSGCALVVDYVLTIIVSIASGADAVFSLLPTEWYQYKLPAASVAVVLMIVLNLRGVKESVLPIVPVFLLFLVTHVVAVVAGFFSHFEVVRSLPQDTANGVRSAVGQFGVWGVVLLVLRAYSMGAGTYTGIEAVSNGLPILREPHVETGKRTMNYMAVSLCCSDWASPRRGKPSTRRCSRA
jgi:amino acid transporter